jgi:hypothetical protein
MMDINASFSREVFPPSMIVPKLNITGKAEILQFLQQQEQQANELQQQQTAVQHAFEDAKLKELYSKAVSNISTARERNGRAESNIGLFEERLSEISRNRALATKDKMEALEKLVDVIAKYGEVEANLKMHEIESFDYRQEANEDREKVDAKQTAMSNKFLEEIMGSGQNSGELQGLPQENQEQMAGNQSGMML